MSDLEQRNEMIRLAGSLFARGYSLGSGGNVSLRLEQERMLITPSGASLGRLNADDLCIVTLDGEHVSGKTPSKEAIFHRKIYQANPQCQAIVHLHSTYLTALSCLKNLDRDNAIKPFTPYYVMRVGRLAVIPYYRPGDPRIADELAKRARSGKAFLMANHGVTVLGESLGDAVDTAEELEEAAKLSFILQNHAINYLTADEIAALTNKE